MNPWLSAVLAALGTVGVTSFALYLCKNFIATWLAKRVEHSFNEKLEVLRTDLRIKEERIKAELREKDNAIAVLRSGAVSAMASRQMAVDKRTLEAVDQLWSAITALAGAKNVCEMVSIIKFEAITDADAARPAMQQLFQTYDKAFDPTKFDSSSAYRARPYVSPMAWALYSAYSAIVFLAVTRVKALANGVNPKGLVKKDRVSDLVRAALPHQAAVIDQYGDMGHSIHLDELEKALLAEIRNMLAGHEADRSALERAAEVLKVANEISARQSESTDALAASGVPRIVGLK